VWQVHADRIDGGFLPLILDHGMLTTHLTEGRRRLRPFLLGLQHFHLDRAFGAAMDKLFDERTAARVD
jgi:hypothetical protein